MRIDVWSDIACPWCWLGKHHLEEALRRGGVEAEVAMRSFELNPSPRPTIPARDYLVRRLGGAERVDAAHARLAALGERAGLRYAFDRALVANTFDAHRVHHLAQAKGRGPETIERFMRAYHGEGADLADPDTITRLAVEAGLDEADVRQVLATDAFADAVRRDEAEARAIGVQGVPFFVIDGRYGISGAQPVEAFEEALRAIQKPSQGG